MLVSTLTILPSVRAASACGLASDANWPATSLLKTLKSSRFMRRRMMKQNRLIAIIREDRFCVSCAMYDMHDDQFCIRERIVDRIFLVKLHS